MDSFVSRTIALMLQDLNINFHCNSCQRMGLKQSNISCLRHTGINFEQFEASTAPVFNRLNYDCVFSGQESNIIASTC